MSSVFCALLNLSEPLWLCVRMLTQTNTMGHSPCSLLQCLQRSGDLERSRRQASKACPKQPCCYALAGAFLLCPLVAISPALGDSSQALSGPSGSSGREFRSSDGKQRSRVTCIRLSHLARPSLRSRVCSGSCAGRHPSISVCVRSR